MEVSSSYSTVMIINQIIILIMIVSKEGICKPQAHCSQLGALPCCTHPPRKNQLCRWKCFQCWGWWWLSGDGLYRCDNTCFTSEGKTLSKVKTWRSDHNDHSYIWFNVIIVILKYLCWVFQLIFLGHFHLDRPIDWIHLYVPIIQPLLKTDHCSHIPPHEITMPPSCPNNQCHSSHLGSLLQCQWNAIFHSAIFSGSQTWYNFIKT